MTEEHVGDIRWLVASGPAVDAFRALGRYAAREIRTVIEQLPEVASLRGYMATPKGRARCDAVARASRRQHPGGWLELAAMAEGAEVDVRDLLLMALRGDLPGAGGTGCSEFGWTDGTRALFGHNEDGDPVLHGLSCLLTLRVEHEPSITTWWYPGFLPGNTFTVNDWGLVLAIDAIQIADPPVAPGRCFVARGLQRAGTLEEALEYLYAHPAAGGFSYFLGKTHESRLLVVEHAGTAVAHEEALPPERPYLWHTNHLCHLPSGMDRPSLDSIARADVLSRVSAPPSPDPWWILRVLAGTRTDRGVRATGEPGCSLTLCTLAVDLEAAEATVLPSGGRAITLPTVDLARGDASRVRVAPH